MRALIVEFQEVFDRVLAMRITYQDDALIERGTGKLIEVDGFDVRTMRRPEIDTTGSIYIGGTGTEYDGTESLAHFGAPEYRTEYLAKARAAIDALNEKLGSQVEELNITSLKNGVSLRGRDEASSYCRKKNSCGGAIALGLTYGYEEEAK